MLMEVEHLDDGLLQRCQLGTVLQLHGHLCDCCEAGVFHSVFIYMGDYPKLLGETA